MPTKHFEFLRRRALCTYKVLLWVRKQLPDRVLLVGCFWREYSLVSLSDLDAGISCQAFQDRRRRRRLYHGGWVGRDYDTGHTLT